MVPGVLDSQHLDFPSLPSLLTDLETHKEEEKEEVGNNDTRYVTVHQQWHF